MKNYRAKLSLMMLLVMMLFNQPEAAVKTESIYKIKSVEAFLFLNQVGEFGENDVTTLDEGFLFNLPISDTEEASRTLLVIVEIIGAPGSFPTSQKLEFIAIEKGKIKLKVVEEMGVFSEEGKYFEAFILNDVGWFPIKISARVIGQNPVSKVEKTIPFSCGE